ncbi:hypothetical protein D3C85_1565510 [compost metagenome]
MGQRARLLLNKQRRAQRHRAAGDKTAAQRHRTKISHAHHVSQRAVPRAISHGLGLDPLFLVRLCQQSRTGLRRQATQFELGDLARLVVELKWRKRIVIRR